MNYSLLVFCQLAPAQEKEAPKQVLFTNVNVWDGTGDNVQNGVDVLVEKNLIKEIGTGLSAAGASVNHDARSLQRFASASPGGTSP